MVRGDAAFAAGKAVSIRDRQLKTKASGAGADRRLSLPR
jgi:hypothetical protein